MTTLVYAFGQDSYWLAAVETAVSDIAVIRSVKCSVDLSRCMENLPPADSRALVLVDATGQASINEIVDRLRSLGWRYVVVVAADPSAKEARAVLRNQTGYDYWPKTYDPLAIRSDLRRCIAEITTELPAIARADPGRSHE